MLLTTHLVEEAGAVADRVVVLHQGRELVTGTPTALAARLPDRTITARPGLDDTVIRNLRELTGFERNGPYVRLTGSPPERLVHQLLSADPALQDLRVEGAGLEEALVHLTAGSSEEVAA